MPLIKAAGVTIVVLLALVGLPVPGSHAQTIEQLQRRIEQLERSTREEIELLKRQVERQEAERVQERRAAAERERTVEALTRVVEEQQLRLSAQEELVTEGFPGISRFFDARAGAKQNNEGPPPYFEDGLPGNLFASRDVNVKLGGSLRLHVQHNDTPVGAAVNSALLPNAAAPGGGNNGGRETFRMFADRSRLYLKLDGPTVHSGVTSARFEMDFQQQANGAGEVNSTSTNPKLRYAYFRWAFPRIVVDGNAVILSFGQMDAFDQIAADTVDFNSLAGGLGVASRRNPRVEIVDKYPVASNLKLLTSLGFERPLFDNQALGGTTDCGSGCLTGFPALSAGVGLETTERLGSSLGVELVKIYARTTWGQFEERFTRGTFTPSLNAQTNFTQHTFDNQTASMSVTFDRVGFSRKDKDDKTLTLKLTGGAVWTRGEGRIVGAEFDRRVILDRHGSLVPAQSVGAWINPQFFLTNDVSIRWAGGTQWALKSDRPAVTGTLIPDPSGAAPTFFRVNNAQSEVSLWWTPGPFTFALGYNFTTTNFRSVTLTGGSESRHNENNKVEFISFWSF